MQQQIVYLAIQHLVCDLINFVSEAWSRIPRSRALGLLDLVAPTLNSAQLSHTLNLLGAKRNLWSSYSLQVSPDSMMKSIQVSSYRYRKERKKIKKEKCFSNTHACMCTYTHILYLTWELKVVLMTQMQPLHSQSFFIYLVVAPRNKIVERSKNSSECICLSHIIQDGIPRGH